MQNLHFHSNLNPSRIFSLFVNISIISIFFSVIVAFLLFIFKNGAIYFFAFVFFNFLIYLFVSIYNHKYDLNIYVDGNSMFVEGSLNYSVYLKCIIWDNIYLIIYLFLLYMYMQYIDKKFI